MGCNALSWFSKKRNLPLNAISSLCNLITYNQKYSGFLIRFPSNENHFYCLFSEKNVITEEMVNNEEKLLIIYDNGNKKVEINLDINERRLEKMNNYNAIGIEILPQDGIEEKYFLIPCKNNNKDEFKNKEIIILGNSICLNGKIDKISNREFSFILNNKGEIILKNNSPILLKDTLEIIGITKEIDKNNSEYNACFIDPINIIKKEKEEIKEQKKIDLLDDGCYFGELNDKEIPNGKGKYTFKNGETYEGDVVNDKFEGKGKYIYEDGKYYIGQWKNNLREGKGILYYSNGNIEYDGNFVNDEFDGTGKYIWEDGEYYVGQYKNGLNYGKGILYYKTGDIKYTGDFVNDEFEGSGKYVYEDKNYYIGEFKNGLKNGKGTLYDKDGNILYEGDFVEGEFHGKGKYVYENGDYYIGDFKNGSCHGFGKEYDKNGNLISEGEWNNNNRV